ncbi:MAG: hypothetical protein ACXVDD_00300 [Polyangia bacterium]
MKQYDLALEAGEEAVRLRESAIGYDTLAEVHHYRHERELAVQCGEHAVALGPDSPALREDLERFRRGDDRPSEVVENIRADGYRWLPQFYGNGHEIQPMGILR